MPVYLSYDGDEQAGGCRAIHKNERRDTVMIAYERLEKIITCH